MADASQLVSLLVLMCHTHTISLKADIDQGIRSRNCRQEVVTNSVLSEITVQSCKAHGLIGTVYWIVNNPTYGNRARWRMKGYECVVGREKLQANIKL